MRDRKVILIMNGEKYWNDIFPSDQYLVVQKRIQDCNCVFRNGSLYFVDKEGTVLPNGILWRVGALDKPTFEMQKMVMNLIHLSGVPCVNNPRSLMKGFDRISMLGYMKLLDMPVIDFNVVTKSTLMSNIGNHTYPFVVKVGNYHGGYGKIKVESKEQFEEIQSLLYSTQDYITTEPFIDYVEDVRYLAISGRRGDNVVAMSRKSSHWRVNNGEATFDIIEPKEHLKQEVLKLKSHLGLDIVAIDVIVDKNGKEYILEYNDIPGLSGWNEVIKYELADILINKIQKYERL